MNLIGIPVKFINPKLGSTNNISHLKAPAMTLIEIISNIEDADEEALIYAKKIGGQFKSTSEAVLLTLTDEELVEPTRDIAERYCPGFEYFLEVFLVKDLLEEMSHTPGFTSLEQQVAKIIHYAENDA